VATIKDGIAMTAEMEKHEKEKTKEYGDPAFIAVMAKDRAKQQTPLKSENFSDWFLPSIGQWLLAFEGVGAKWTGSEFSGGRTAAWNKILDLFTKAGLNTLSNEYDYYTTTQYTTRSLEMPQAWLVGYKRGINHVDVYEVNSARCFFAFK